MKSIDCFSLKGKNAVITGAAGGLSLGMAKALYDAGATITLFDLNDKVSQTAKSFGEERPVFYAKGNLTIKEDRESMVKTAIEKMGSIDILVNGAGIQHREEAQTFPQDIWERVVNVNLNSVFYISQEIGNLMLKQGSGKIINIASMCSFFGSVMIPAYSASKGGIAQMTKALSNEWASKGVCVNAIAPGYMATDLTANLKEKNPKQYEEITNRIPMKRWGDGADLGGAVIFLASSASNYISGAIIPVDGGYLGK